MALRAETIKKINGFMKTAQAEGEEEISPEELLEDVEEIVEEEVEEAEEEPEDADVSGIEERMDTLEETLEVIVDGLADQKDILESVLTGETGKEDEFEEFVEDEQEVEEVSPEEFGFEEDSDLITAEEDDMSDLRAKRKARLKKEAETIGDQFGVDKAKNKKFGPKAPEVQMGKPPKHELPDMYKLADLSLEQSDDKKAWNVLNKDALIYVVPQGNIDGTKFASPEFARQIIRDMQKMGIIEALTKYNATKHEEKKAEVKDFGKAQAADFRRRFIRAFRLALTAMNKNLVKPIPLKVAMFEVLDGLEIDQPEAIIEAVFDRGAIKHFEAAIVLTEKYLDMGDEAFIEAEAMIGNTEVATVSGEREIEREASADAQALRIRARKSSLPFSTASEADLSGMKERLAAAMPKPKLTSMFEQLGT